MIYFYVISYALVGFLFMRKVWKESNMQESDSGTLRWLVAVFIVSWIWPFMFLRLLYDNFKKVK